MALFRNQNLYALLTFYLLISDFHLGSGQISLPSGKL